MYLFAIGPLLSLFTLLNPIHSQTLPQNCTTSEFTTPISSSYWRFIFIFTCSPTTPFNPTFPQYFLSQATKYNEIDMSPNFFTQIPIASLCQFKYTTSLDMSHNYLSSLRNAFVSLKCLTALSNIDFSNNLISTSILASDFDDTLAAQIGSLNLTNNLIPSIESRAFLRLDGSSRFPELTYLGLALNRIKDFDVLWPLTLPSPILTVDLKMNPISNLVNQFGFTYTNNIFRFNMTGYRRVDVTTNSLQYLDDTNILQYGLYNANDMRDFLIKISNYDFRQSNLVRTFICYCPPYGLLTVSWYKQIASQLDPTRPIFQLYCKEYSNLVYVFNFPCNETQSVTSTITTTTTTSTSKTSGNVENQLGPQSQPTDPNLYYLLFLLLIPLILLLILLFVCCFGRWCQVNSSHTCNLLLCPCLRPNDKSQFSGKSYDTTICYNRFDENWVDEEFLSEILRYEANFKVHKLAFTGRSIDKMSRENEKIMRTSKRLILIFSQDFAEDEFKNRAFLSILKDVVQNDPNCIVIAINKGIDAKYFDYCVNYLDSPTLDHKNFERNGYYEKKSACGRLMANIKYHCGLRDVERLDFGRQDFWKNFFYTMPMFDFDDTKASSVTKSKKAKLDYAGDYKDPKNNLRHIVIPIPEFMKTKLGFHGHKNSSSKKIPNELRVSTRSTSIMPTSNSYGYQQNFQHYESRDLFSAIPYSHRTATPIAQDLSNMPVPAALSTYNRQLSIQQHHRRENSSLGLTRNSFSSTIQQEAVVDVNGRPPVRRSETPDILALFAPKPNQIIEMRQGSSMSSSSSTKRRSKSESKSKEYRRQHRLSESSANRVILQGSPRSNDEIDA